MDPEFDELKREFLAEALDKVEEMDRAIGEGDDGSRERVVYLAHQLKGSGGSYGFRQISAEASEIERIAESSSEGWKDQAEALGGRLQRLREIIGAQQHELG